MPRRKILKSWIKDINNASLGIGVANDIINDSPEDQDRFKTGCLHAGIDAMNALIDDRAEKILSRIDEEVEVGVDVELRLERDCG